MVASIGIIFGSFRNHSLLVGIILLIHAWIIKPRNPAIRTGAIFFPDSNAILKKIKLSRKQFYSRLSALKKAGLVKRRENSTKLVLTSFGYAIYNAQSIIEEALSTFWKLKALDEVVLSDTATKEETFEIIDALLLNEKIKEIVKQQLDLR